MRDGEGLYLANGPWTSGGWSIYGSRGSIVRNHLRIDGVDEEIRYDRAEVDGVGFTRRVEAHGIEWTAAYPEHPLDDDARAIAQCIDDWLARLDGSRTETQWSLADGVADLRWIAALERSATLGGAPILL